jgi:hypothetical protein
LPLANPEEPSVTLPAFRPRSFLFAATVVAATLAPVGAVHATSILFIGNSFTYGEGASVRNYATNTVTDLRGTGIGGVPALFKSFSVQAGFNYDVFLETQPGSNLDYHYLNQRLLIDQPWDRVVMHGQSNLNFAAPGNPALISQYTDILGDMFRAKNPNVEIALTATWSRADLTYLPAAPANSPWRGGPIEQMGIDVQKGYEVAAAQNADLVDHVNPVGLVWNAAFAAGVADRNPYDGIAPGLLNLWAADAYHASNYGYYLHALTVFALETGYDVRLLGGNELAGTALGFTSAQMTTLQSLVALTVTPVPEPETWATMALGLGVLGWLRARRRETHAA